MLRSTPLRVGERSITRFETIVKCFLYKYINIFIQDAFHKEFYMLLLHKILYEIQSKKFYNRCIRLF